MPMFSASVSAGRVLTHSLVPLACCLWPMRALGAPTVIENRALRVKIEPETASISVYDRRCRKSWLQPPPAGRPDRNPFRDITRVPNGVRFTTTAGSQTVITTVTLSPTSPDLSVETDRADRDAPFTNIFGIDSFLPMTPAAYLAVADYCDGHLYPLNLKPFPKPWLAADRLDMPWFGVADGLNGSGYIAIIETSDDACVDMQPAHISGSDARAPRIGWLPSRGRFAYARRVQYRFIETGGYVAMAKAYRSYARKHGILVRLAEKARRNPNVKRLYGAVDVWGDASLSFAQEAHAHGVRRMLIHGACSADQMRAINALGYLSSEYDNYTDILPVEAGKPPDSSHDNLPDAAVMNRDQSRMKAWLTYDKKTQYMKRCPALWESTARRVISDRLKELPFLGRFIDVTTAEGLYECFDPKHPLSRTGKRQCGERLLSAVTRLGLVAGGEHGIWWAVPYLSYVEGMLSSYQFAWPAGHLIRPKSRSETFDGPYKTDTWDNYERWGIGHAYRVPLWQLVFHDCVASTWYWGDSNDFLIEAAPDLTDKKDAFNILYGTMPMLWANADGSWNRNRSAFLRTATIATAVHRSVAPLEMTEHRFLTSDRSLQRTRFADGTTCFVNFGRATHALRLPNETVSLPQNGFAVRGPTLRMTRAVIAGQTVTTCRGSDWTYREQAGRTVAAWVCGTGCIALRVSGSRGVRLEWADMPIDGRPSEALIYPVQPGGGRQAQVGRIVRGGHRMISPGTYEVLYGHAAAAPDLRISAESHLTATDVGPGKPVGAVLSIANRGGRTPARCTVMVFSDRAGPGRLVTSRMIAIGPRGITTVRLRIPTSRLDGRRRLIFRVQSFEQDLCLADNELSLPVYVRKLPRTWEKSATVVVEAGSIDRTAQPIVTPMPWDNADPASVRVFEDVAGVMRPCPSQVDVLQNERVLCFVPQGAFPAHSRRSFSVVWNAPRGSRLGLLPHVSARVTPDGRNVRAVTYSADLHEGVLRNLAVIARQHKAIPAISKILASSAETGWTDEAGMSCTTGILSDGPVRTIVQVRKQLTKDIRYVKEYTFYDDRFDVRTLMEPVVGIPCRAFYTASGQIRDAAGRSAVIDGRGEAEGMTGGGPVLWYEVRGNGWSHSCVTLAPSASLAYWDASEWGGVGFVSREAQAQVVSYRFYPNAQGPGIGDADRTRLTSPPMIQIPDRRLP